MKDSSTHRPVTTEGLNRWRVFLFLFLMVLLVPACSKTPQPPTTINVAAAANLNAVLPKLEASYKVLHPSANFVAQFGSSGVLSQQIVYGSEVDLFLSADVKQADLLRDKLKLDASQQFEYASGKLAVFGLLGIEKPNQFEAINWSTIKTIAIANPQLAPYGKAAVQAIEAAKNDDATSATSERTPTNKPELVYAPDATAVLQMVASGAVDLGFSAASLQQTASEKLWMLEVPKDLYQPIRQAGLRLNADDADCKSFVDFLLSDEGQSIFIDNGYHAIEKDAP
jgi:molybdate transport system substrate-binding protein